MTSHADLIRAQYDDARSHHNTKASELTMRLDNWARWCRVKRVGLNTCRSIEHRYRAPQCWYPEEAKLEVDELDAVKIEKVIGKLPSLVRVSLRAHYIFGGRYKKNEHVRRIACVDMSLNWSKYEEAVNVSERMLQNRLDEL